jgi:ABC-2 type transport system ATP-binding protein
VTPANTILAVRDLVKEYPGVRAVDGISFSVSEGTCFGLLGPNGAGKTTTVEIMEGVIPATAGAVLYRGSPIGRRFREEAGIQFQSTALQDYLTVAETLDLFRKLYGRVETIDEVVEMCSLGELLDRDTRKLSGGQRQRLFLGIALINRPALVFLDEPTTGLDPQARRNFWQMVEGIKARNTTIVLTTHYMEEAYILCDAIAIMDHGKIIAQGSPQALLAEHFDDVVLELPKEDWPNAVAGFDYQVLRAGQNVEISTADVNTALAALTDAGVPLQRLRIRPRNLEDLFIELTGKELRA